jgi:ligand-binding sensor domain-containing protein
MSFLSMQNLVIDPDGSLWVATLGGGIAHYQAGKFHSYTSRDGLPSDDIGSLYRDSQGTMWIGTRGGGIARLVQGRFEKLSLAIRDGSQLRA